MTDYILTLEYAIQFFLAILIVSLFVVKGRQYMTAQRQLKAEFLTAPVNTSLTILTFIIPLVIAAVAYSESKGYTSGLPTILTSLSLLFICVLVAIWINFTLLKKGNSTDIITLDYPKDKQFISALGVIYGLLFFSFVYLGKYILFDFKMEKPVISVTENPYEVLVQRQAIFPGMSHDEVHALWGRPQSYDSAMKTELYKTEKQVLQLQYDEANNLNSIIIKKP